MSLRSHTQTQTADKYGIPVVRFSAFAAQIGIPVKSFLVKIAESGPGMLGGRHL